VELDRIFIERRDFSVSRRGYDPDEVERHLREVAEAMEELRQRAASTPPPGQASLATTAADQVRNIVEAAENSAAEIEQRARDEAQRVSDEAARDSRATRDKADAEAAAHVQRVEDSTGKMLQRADSVEAEIERVSENLRTATDSLLEDLRSTAGTMVENLRGGAGALQADLQEIRAGLGDLRESAPYAAPGDGDGGAAEVAAPEEPSVAETVIEQPSFGEPSTVEPSAEPAFGEPTPEPAFSEPERWAPAEPLSPEPSEVGGPPDAEPGIVTEAQETLGATPADQAPADFGAPPAAEAPAPRATTGGSEGARLIALNMALNGTPREETARYLSDNFDLPDQEAILDEVYARAGGG
jgi:DivIVA domain-containing protein